MDLLAQAEALFETYNEKYFAGVLAGVEIKLVKGLKLGTGKHRRLLGATSKTENGFLIELDPETESRTRKLILAHELVHVKIWPKSHRSKAWKEEIRRLSELGFLFEIF